MRPLKVAMMGVLLIISAFAQAITESFIQSRFASAAAGSTDWHASYTRSIIPIASGYLVVGSNEVSSNTTGLWTAGTTLYAMKLTSGLSRDTGYGVNGVQALSLPEGYYYRLPAVKHLPSGKFLVAAEAINNIDGDSGESIILARFNADATPDISFGSPSSPGSIIVSMPCSGTSADAPSLTVQSTGKIVLTGTVLCTGAGRSGFMARFSADGVRETAFGTNGYLLINPRETGTWMTMSVLDGEGRLLVVGDTERSDTDPTTDSFIARITLGATPEIDVSFNSTGYRIIAAGGESDAWPTSVVMDGSDILIASRTTSDGGGTALTRLLSTGALDTSFGTTGTVRITTDLYTESYVGDIIAVDSGYYLIGALDNRRAIIKVTDTGALDTADVNLGASGYWRSNISNASIFLRGIVHEGKLLVAGFSVSETGVSTENNNELESTSLVISSFALSGGASGSTTDSSSSSSGGGSADWLGLFLLAGLILVRRCQPRR